MTAPSNTTVAVSLEELWHQREQIVAQMSAVPLEDAAARHRLYGLQAELDDAIEAAPVKAVSDIMIKVRLIQHVFRQSPLEAIALKHVVLLALAALQRDLERLAGSFQAATS